MSNPLVKFICHGVLPTSRVRLSTWGLLRRNTASNLQPRVFLLPYCVSCRSDLREASFDRRFV
jgi:hypothetical protein